MTGFKEYDDYDALGLAELVAKGDVSADELLDEAIERTERINPAINAIVMKHYDEARAAIKTGLPKGPFTGVPFLLKDLHVLLNGTITTYGSSLFEGYVADHDATLTERYKKAGLVIFGKTNSPEFGLTLTTEPRLFGPTKNPWNLEHSPGGSSGGASAAVAAGILPLANASDGGGSIRVPASCTGTFGMKPTRARTPMGPDRGEGWAGQSSVHAISRTVRDSAALLDASMGTAPGDPYEVASPARPYLEDAAHDPKPLRIAKWTKRSDGTDAHPEIVAAIEDAAKLCEDLGHNVEEATVEFDVDEQRRAQVILIAANIALVVDARLAALGREQRQGDVETATAALAELGRSISGPDYAGASLYIHQLSRKYGAFHETYDLYLTPTLALPPAPLGVIDMMSEDTANYTKIVREYCPYTAIANQTGQPSMSVPLHWTESGLPIGTMFTAKFGDEATLFQLSGQLERARPWGQKRAPTWAA